MRVIFGVIAVVGIAMMIGAVGGLEREATTIGQALLVVAIGGAIASCGIIGRLVCYLIRRR